MLPVVFLALLGLLQIEGFKSGALSLSGGVLKAARGPRDFFEFLQEILNRKAVLVTEVQMLRSKNTELEMRNSGLAARNKELLRVQNLFSVNPVSGKLGLVLSSDPESPYDALVVSLGSENGVRSGQKAVAYGSIFLGEVSKIASKTSVVKLFSYPGLMTDAFLESQSLNVALEGLGDANFKFLVPKNIGIKIGDRIISNSEPAYLLGQVEHFKERPSEPLIEVRVRAPVNLRELRYIELRP